LSGNILEDKGRSFKGFSRRLNVSSYYNSLMYGNTMLPPYLTDPAPEGLDFLDLWLMYVYGDKMA